MIILAMDPSYTHLAFSLFDGKSVVYMDTCSFKLGEYMGFDRTFEACRDLWLQLSSKLDDLLSDNNMRIDKVISEIPPISGQFSSGLFALDTYILSNLFDKYTSIKEIYIVAPSYLTTIHGVRSYKKSDSTKLAKYFINEVLSDKISVSIPDSISDKGRRTKGVINNDKAESFLFLLRMFCRENILDCRDIISYEMAGLGKDAEKLLISRN